MKAYLYYKNKEELRKIAVIMEDLVKSESLEEIEVRKEAHERIEAERQGRKPPTA
jgi:hypothetical protein